LPQVLEYNVLGGKYNRGLTVLIAFRELVEPRKQDAESLQRALTVGWCVELVRGMEEGQEMFPRVRCLGEKRRDVSVLCLCFCVSSRLQPHLGRMDYFKGKPLRGPPLPWGTWYLQRGISSFILKQTLRNCSPLRVTKDV
jgi:hypothetical protein